MYASAHTVDHCSDIMGPTEKHLCLAWRIPLLSLQLDGRTARFALPGRRSNIFPGRHHAP